MAGKREKPKPNGTLIRGADGALYFILDSKLHAFRVLEKDEASVNAELDKVPSKDKIPITGVECIGVDLFLQIPRKRKPPRK